jgi:uncharacterized protein YcaQ
VDELVTAGALERVEIDGLVYVWPVEPSTVGGNTASSRVAGSSIDDGAGRVDRSGLAAAADEERVRFLAPFDPVVWDRRRFAHLWGWPYRFEAYTPRAKRRFGYYALPLLWRDHVVGWVNVTSAPTSGLDVAPGYVDGGPPRGKAFRRAFDAEVDRLRALVGSRDDGDR